MSLILSLRVKDRLQYTTCSNVEQTRDKIVACQLQLGP